MPRPTISAAVGLLVHSLAKQSLSKALNSGEKCGGNSGVGPLVILSTNDFILEASKGTLRQHISYRMHPKAQMSEAQLYGLSSQISGLR